MQSLNASVGAANGTTTASCTWKFRSGILRLPHHFCSLAQCSKEAADFFPDLSTAGKPAPVGAYQAHELIALVHGSNEIIRYGGAARITRAVHQQRFNIAFHVAQRRMRP